MILHHSGWVCHVHMIGLGTWHDWIRWDAVRGAQMVEWQGGAGGGNSEWASMDVLSEWMKGRG